MDGMRHNWYRSPGRLAAAGLLLATVAGATRFTALQPPATHASSVCNLTARGNDIHHVIALQFDNFHLTRDNPNVPSDLEQIPSLLNFMRGKGILFNNMHTPLISHTANDILTTQTGLYGDRHGNPIANSWRYYNPDGTTSGSASFSYWTDPVSAIDPEFNMVTQRGVNAPATWVAYTRAGCNFGAAGAANVVLENTGADVSTVFGANSPQAIETRSNPDQAYADFVGIGVHCALGDPVCSAAHGGVPDLLPSEPGGYQGYSALFGAKYVNPVISPEGPLRDLSGKIIKSPAGYPGFTGTSKINGFDYLTPNVTLGWVASMQEHNIPVTYTYLTNAHNKIGGGTYGPGEAGYVANLKADDTAFAAFFQRLANDGINASNTLFVISSDEGDHFVGGDPSPAGCDGVTIPCTYSKIGEVNGNLTGLLAQQTGTTTPFSVHADMAPNFYLTGHQAPDATTSAFEKAVGSLTARNPITGQVDQVTQQMAGPAQMKILHMVNADPARTPTFTMFANPSYFLFAGPPDCGGQSCITIGSGFAWNHGSTNQEVVTTWTGMVGPGVRWQGLSNAWADETDIRPTIDYVTGLKDDYVHDGRVLYEGIGTHAVPSAPEIAAGSPYLALAQTYKQLMASVGDFAYTTLQADTVALKSGDTTLEATLAGMASDRDAIAAKMRTALNEAEFGATPITAANAQPMILQAQILEAKAHTMISSLGSITPPPASSGS